MFILRHYEHVPRSLQGAVFAIGNFDGVHPGHVKVIGEAARVARELDVPLGVLVFEPHPRQFFKPDQPYFRLTPFRTKARLLSELGVDVLAALPFNEDMAKKLAEDFVLDVMVNGFHASHLVVGYDFRLGKARAGDTSTLLYMSEMEGFGVSIVEVVSQDGQPFSSTRIRELLAQGDPRGAARMLGHWWTIETQIQTGDRRGRTIGFPTANLPLKDHVQPALGVYAVRIEIEDGPHKGIYDGVANIGKRPTFDKRDVLLEAHIFDFKGDLYGVHAAVAFIEYLRPEQKFDGLESLKAQIAKDSARAREVLATVPQGGFELKPLSPA